MRIVGVASDGAWLLVRELPGADIAWQMAPDGAESARWTPPERIWTAVEIHGRWFVSADEVVEIRDRAGELLSSVVAPCLNVQAVDQGLRLSCPPSPKVVTAEGGLLDGPSTLTAPNGDRLELGADTVSLWSDGAVRWSVAARGPVVPSPDGRRVLIDGKPYAMDTGRPLAKVAGNGWAPDGAITVRGTNVDAETGLVVPRPDGHGGSVTAVGWSSDGSRLATGGDDGAVLVWDPAGGPPIARLDRAVPVSLQWQGPALVVTWADAVVGRWIPGEPEPRFTIQAKPGVPAIVLPRGRLAVSDGRSVQIHDREGAVVEEWAPPGNHLVHVVGVNGRLLATAGGVSWRVGRERPLALGVGVVELLPGGAGARLDRGGGTWTTWSPGHVRRRGEPPQATWDPRVSRSGVTAWSESQDPAIHLIPPGPIDGRPIDLVVVATVDELRDPDVLLEALGLFYVPGDRVAWIVPGAVSEPRWVPVGDPEAVLQAQVGSDPRAEVCPALELLPVDPDHQRVMVVGAPGEGCLARAAYPGVPDARHVWEVLQRARSPR